MTEKFTVLDLFSGAGGLTEGFSIDSFRFIAHIEMDPNAARTLETRLGYHLLRGTRFEEEVYRPYQRNEISREEYIAKVRGMNLFDDNLFVKQISSATISDLFDRIDDTLRRIERIT